VLLKIDVDRPRGRLPRRELERRARIVHVRIGRVVDTRSPSGRGWHRRIEIERMEGDNGRALRMHGGRSVRTLGKPFAVRPFSPFEVVFLQLLFGSDPIRESFNWHRARLVQAGAVPPFWRSRFNTLYATSGGR